MAEPVRDDFERYGCLGAKTCMGVGQAVESDRRNLCPFDTVEHGATDVPRVYG
jgi:hypothetical protein